MRCVAAALALALAGCPSFHAGPLPGTPAWATFVDVDGVHVHYRELGQGPAVVLLHGFGDTGDMSAPLAAELVRDHTVVVPDLRGMGLSWHPAGGYDKKTQAGDIRAVRAHLGVDHAAVVGHDIGTMVAYAYAAVTVTRPPGW